jgi:hypothetical protein
VSVINPAWTQRSVLMSRNVVCGLAPLDVEAFRSRYGQAALFRLRLGIDSIPDPDGVCSVPAPMWGESAERPLYDHALVEGSYFLAGQIVAGWRHRAARCH